MFCSSVRTSIVFLSGIISHSLEVESTFESEADALPLSSSEPGTEDISGGDPGDESDGEGDRKAFRACANTLALTHNDVGVDSLIHRFLLSSTAPFFLICTSYPVSLVAQNSTNLLGS